jgi:hypothetical protein
MGGEIHCFHDDTGRSCQTATDKMQVPRSWFAAAVDTHIGRMA